MLLVEVADEAAPLLCRSGVEALSALFTLCPVLALSASLDSGLWGLFPLARCGSALLGRLAPLYIGGRDRLTCRVLVGHS